MQKKLRLQIILRLRLDTGAGSLVALTLHGTTLKPIRIAKDRPQVKERLPFLGVAITQSVPLIGSDATGVQRARVEFRCYAAKEGLAEAVADRLENLLHDSTGESNRGFYNFSGSDVSVRSTRFKNRVESTFDEDKDAWKAVIEADVIWVDQPCP